MADKPVHYVSNAKLTKAMTEWIRSFEPDKPRPPMPKYVGECIMMIVERFGRKYQFSSYSYLDEMKSEAIMTCVKYAHNFNPDKSQNAFAYVTQIVSNSFIAIINNEKRLAELKFKMVKELNPTLGKQDWNDIKLEDSSHGEPLPVEFIQS